MTISPPQIRHHRRRTPRTTALVVLALVAALLASLVAFSPAASAQTEPPKPGEQPIERDMYDMTDEELEQSLAAMAPDLAKAWQDKEFQASIPADEHDQMQKFYEQLQTKDGRYAVIPELRKVRETQGDPPKQVEQSLDGVVTEAAGTPLRPSRPPTSPGTRSASPPAATVSSMPVPNAAGPCQAPDGVGTVTAPATTRAGQLLSPAHDVYTKLTPGIAVNGPMVMSPTGVEPVPGQGPGVQFGRGLTVMQQTVLVRVNLEDPKHFGPRALFPLISIKPIGGGPADERLVQFSQMRNPKVYCYAGDSRADRGYFEAWVPVGGVEPGFQVIAEVVDNDWFFQNVLYDALLATPGPQYFAGADRSTVHASEADTLTSAAQSLPNAAGAFVSSAPDPAAGISNVLTDTNGVRNDDIEGPIASIVRSTISDKINEALSDDLLPWWILGALIDVNGSVAGHYDTQVDLRFSPLHDGSLDPSDEPAGPTGALRADVGIHNLTIDLTSHIHAAWCSGLSVTIDADANAKAWADPVGNGLGIDPKVDVSTDYSDDWSSSWGARFNPICWITRGFGKLLADYFVSSAISDGVKGAFDYDDDGDPGAVQKIFDGLDLNSVLPTLSIGGATIKPVVTNIDNGWCGSAAGFAGCDPNSDLLDSGGIGVSGDGTVVGSLSDALGNPLLGKFRNVFRPSTFSSVEDLVTGHRDSNGVSAGLGAVLDPALVNLAMRHIATGSRTDGSTNGLLNLSNVTVPVINQTLSAKPEVAPMVVGQPKPPPVLTQTSVRTAGDPSASVITKTPTQFLGLSRPTVPVVIPDMRLDLVTAPNTPPIQFTAAASTNVGVAFDPGTGGIRPVFDPPVFDLQVTSGCQADYIGAYAASYALCGRGYNGNGGASTLTGVVDLIAGQVVGPLLSDTIGAIKLPDLDGIVPGMNVALTNVRFAQRGSFLAVYADLRATPRLIVSTSGGTTSTGTLTIHALPGDFPSTGPISFSWKVTDEVTGKNVSFQGSGNTITVSMSQFTLGQTDFGRAKSALIQVTATQGAFSITGYGGHSWWPPGGGGGGGGGGGQCAINCP